MLGSGHRPFSSILDACQEGIICLDAEGQVILCNPSAERMLRQPKELLSRLKPYDPLFNVINERGCRIRPEEHPSQVVLRTGEPCLNKVQGIKGDDGTITWINLNATPLPPLKDGRPGGVVISMSDITQAKELEFRLRTEAYRDALTGAYNRRYFQEVLLRAVKAADRFGHPMSLAMCDLDHFKEINDTYGHGSGDRAIQAFSETIHWDMRKDDLVARIGGDEFCLVFMHAPAKNATHFLERIRRQLESLEVITEAKQTIKLRASFGIADFELGDSPEKLMDRADLALYQAKAKGGNQIVLLNQGAPCALAAQG